MRKQQRRKGIGTALFLAAVLSIAALYASVSAEGVLIKPQSLLPLNEVRVTVDLRGFLPAELKAFPMATLLDKMESVLNNGKKIVSANESVMWVKHVALSDGNDDFKIEANPATAVIDLSLDEPKYGSDTLFVYPELIVGTANQLDKNNTRYIVTAQVCHPKDLYNFELYTQEGGVRKPVLTIKGNEPADPEDGDEDPTDPDPEDNPETGTPGTAPEGGGPIPGGSVSDGGGSLPGGGDDPDGEDIPPPPEEETPEDIRINSYWNDDTASAHYNISVPSAYDPYTQYYLGLSLKTRFNQDVGVRVYQGFYETAEAAEASGEDVTEKVWNQSMTKNDAGLKGYGWHREFTLVFRKGGEDPSVYRMSVSVSPRERGVHLNGVYGNTGVASSHSSYYVPRDDQATEITAKLKRGYSASREYGIELTYVNEGVRSNEKVTKAVVGHYNSEEDASSAKDIQDQLFFGDAYDNDVYTPGGYFANYSGDGVDFTVFAEGEVYKLTVRVEEAAPEEEDDPDGPPAPPDGPDLTPSVTFYGAVGLSTYRISPNDDTYSQNGYQTLLVMPPAGGGSPSVSLGDVKPNFYASPSGTRVAVDGSEQTSGDSAQNFSSGPVQYAAFSSDGKTSRNYWVSFAAKETGGPKLFVNGPNAAAGEARNNEKNTRELFLIDAYDNRHDIFIANLGDEDMGGLQVECNATNVKLDDYWKVGGDKNTTLAAFTTTSTSSYGKLPNIAKIRLLPAGAGEIDGTLTISAISPGGLRLERVVHLTGVADNPKIEVKNEPPSAVKYVPYSYFVHTNSMYSWSKVSFTLVYGSLPEGVKLMQSGEVYGVPRETGEFSFKVRADFDTSAYTGKLYDGTPLKFPSSEREFKLTVNDNTDINVDSAIDLGYGIEAWVPRTMTSAQNQIFQSKGEYAEFIDFWIDGDKLTRNIDYAADSGSTVISIYAQTFSRYGSGTHTIAAEFRVGGDLTKDLHRTAQNYTLDLRSGSGDRGGGGVIPQAFKTPKNGSAQSGGTPALSDRFTDIGGHWAESAIRAVIERGLFTGVSETRFDADGSLSRAMIVTVLWRLAGQPASLGASPFRDMGAGQWYGDAVAWAAENGIVQGYESGRFGTEDSVTREQIVTILHRFATLSGTDVSVRADMGAFSDTDAVPTWAADAMAWAVGTGLIRGRDDSTLAPGAGATRAELATIIVRFLDAEAG